MTKMKWSLFYCKWGKKWAQCGFNRSLDWTPSAAVSFKWISSCSPSKSVVPVVNESVPCLVSQGLGCRSGVALPGPLWILRQKLLIKHLKWILLFDYGWTACYFCKILHYCGVAVYSLNKGCFYTTSELWAQKLWWLWKTHLKRMCMSDSKGRFESVEKSVVHLVDGYVRKSDYTLTGSK